MDPYPIYRNVYCLGDYKTLGLLLFYIQVFVKKRKEGGGEKSISFVLAASRPRELQW